MTIYKLQEELVLAHLLGDATLAEDLQAEIERRAKRNGRLKSERMAVSTRDLLDTPKTYIPTPSTRELMRKENQPIYNDMVRCLQNKQIDVATVYLDELERRAERNGRPKTVRLAQQARRTFQRYTGDF